MIMRVILIGIVIFGSPETRHVFWPSILSFAVSAVTGWTSLVIEAAAFRFANEEKIGLILLWNGWTLGQIHEIANWSLFVGFIVGVARWYGIV